MALRDTFIIREEASSGTPVTLPTKSWSELLIFLDGLARTRGPQGVSARALHSEIMKQLDVAYDDMMKRLHTKHDAGAV